MTAPDYDFMAVEARWQDHWERAGLFETPDAPRDDCRYVLMIEDWECGSRNIALWMSWVICCVLELVDGGSDETALVDRVKIICAGLVDESFEIAMEVFETCLPEV